MSSRYVLIPYGTKRTYSQAFGLGDWAERKPKRARVDMMQEDPEARSRLKEPLYTEGFPTVTNINGVQAATGDDPRGPRQRSKLALAQIAAKEAYEARKAKIADTKKTRAAPSTLVESKTAGSWLDLR